MSAARVPFYEANRETGMNAMVRNVLDGEMRYTQHDRPMIALDDFCSAEGIVPDLVKIDVEGAEVDVFEGGRRMFQSAKPEVVLSVHPSFLPRYHQSIQSLCAIVQGLGYRSYVAGTSMDSAPTESREYLLVHESR